MLALCLSACGEREPGRVVAADHDRFWLWAGVLPPDDLANAREVYVLDGEIRAAAPAAYVTLRPAPPAVRGPSLWLVVRTDTLDWPGGTAARLARRIERWREAGSKVAGLQIDFDAKTRRLDDYAAFLKGVRGELPSDDQLSITGLMDWSAHGNPSTLAAMDGVIDEVVIQTYQDTSTIPGYDAYFERMKGFPLPFKVGLVEGGQWFAPNGLEREPNFGGYVVFLARR